MLGSSPDSRPRWIVSTELFGVGGAELRSLDEPVHRGEWRLGPLVEVRMRCLLWGGVLGVAIVLGGCEAPPGLEDERSAVEPAPEALSPPDAVEPSRSSPPSAAIEGLPSMTGVWESPDDLFAGVDADERAEPRGVLRIRFGEVRVEGSRPVAEVRRALLHRIQSVRACAEQTDAVGRTTLTLRIAARGSVESLELESSTFDDVRFQRCLSETEWPFPPVDAEEETIVRAPFSMSLLR